MFTESFGTQLNDLLERLCLNLQLTPTQHSQAEERYGAVGNWLSTPESPLSKFGSIYPQGSLAIGTTVKPRIYREFDLDLVFETRINFTKIHPLDLLNAVESRLRDNETYKKMIERKNRCIRLNYANEFHLDILPACVNPSAGKNCVVVPDRELKTWKHSNPRGYVKWFLEKSRTFKLMMAERIDPLPDYEPGPLKEPLKRAVQLLKRWRDITFRGQEYLAPISIVLTTLAAHGYRGEQQVNDAMGSILDYIVSELPAGNKRLVVLNPTDIGEDLSERWDKVPEAYRSFAVKIGAFQKQWHALNESSEKEWETVLQTLFGEEIVKSAVLQQTRAFNKARSRGELGINRTTGILTSRSGEQTIPVKPNTFHGE